MHSQPTFRQTLRLSGIGKEKAEKLEERKKSKRPFQKHSFPPVRFLRPTQDEVEKRKKGRLEKKNDSQINQTIQGWTLIVEDKG